MLDKRIRSNMLYSPHLQLDHKKPLGSYACSPTLKGPHTPASERGPEWDVQIQLNGPRQRYEVSI